MANLKDRIQAPDFGVREIFSRMHTMLIMPLSRVLNMFGSSSSIPTDDQFIEKNGKKVLNPEYAKNTAAFIGKILATNVLTSTAQSASTALEAVVAEALFVSGKMWYYKFLINPQNMRMNHAKLQAINEASDLTIINTYRNTAPTLSFSGVSGCTLPRDFMRLSGSATKLPTETMARYPKLSTAWIKFRQLEYFYNQVNSDIVIAHDMDIYVGKFVSFNYSQDAENPWIINYEMQLRIYPDMMVHTTSQYEFSKFFNAMVSRYGHQFSSDFEGKSNIPDTNSKAAYSQAPDYASA